MTVIFEGPKAFYLGAQAAIVEDGRELAWAERYVTKQPDIKWILGNFVEADHHNGNGHFFPLEDLKTCRASINNKPLNMVHHEHQICGAFVGQELLEPAGEHAGAGVTTPHVEALAAFWHYYFPDLYEKVVLPAHKEGTLFFSMEARPKTLTCMGGAGAPQGCGREFAYDGPKSETYCAHLNGPGARKRLNQPHFTAGALIVPPVRPGWAHADITEMSSLDSFIKHHLQEAEMAYSQIADEFPHLDAKQWERMMAQVLTGQSVSIDPKSGASGGKVETWVTDPTPTVPHALPDGTFNIFNEASLRSAVAIAVHTGIVGPDEEAREHILRRADALGLMNAEGIADILAAWRALYPDWKTAEPSDADAGYSVMASLAELGFGLYDDFELEYEVARDFSKGRRDKLAKKGLALDDGSFPIATVGDLKNAIKAIGRAGAGKRAKVMAHIKKRAATLGATKLLPEGW